MATSDASRVSAPAPSYLASLVRRYPLVSFFLMAYSFSWLVSMPFILAEWGVVPASSLYVVFFIVKSFGPALAAYVTLRVTTGHSAVRALRRSITQWRVGWPWYAFVLVGFPAVILLGIVALPAARSSFRGLPPAFAASYLVSFVVIAFGGGPLGEEPGWRGYALPQLQSRFGAVRANLVLGVLWTFWHLPDFLTTAQKGGAGATMSAFTFGLPVFFLEVMALTLIFSWVFNHTGGSVFIAILLHATYNTFGNAVQPLFAAPIMTATDLPFVVGVGSLAVVLALLTRGQLGYARLTAPPRSGALRTPDGS